MDAAGGAAGFSASGGYAGGSIGGCAGAAGTHVSDASPTVDGNPASDAGSEWATVDCENLAYCLAPTFTIPTTCVIEGDSLPSSIHCDNGNTTLGFEIRRANEIMVDAPIHLGFSAPLTVWFDASGFQSRGGFEIGTIVFRDFRPGTVRVELSDIEFFTQPEPPGTCLLHATELSAAPKMSDQ